MPVLIKDMNDVKDMRTTYGSKLYADHIPKKSDIVVQTIEKNGGSIIGKTNEAVFPVPVCAQPSISRPIKAKGIDKDWILVGSW